MSKSVTEVAEQVSRELLNLVDPEAQIKVSLTQDNRKRSNLKIEIESKEPRQLIGQYGANLAGLQHIIRLLVSAKLDRPCFANVDVNNYKSEKEKKVLDIAKSMADKALRTDSMVILKPMSGYERRLVHVVVQKMNGVTSESMGQEPERRVVIKPSRESRVVQSFQDKGLTLDDIKI